MGIATTTTLEAEIVIQERKTSNEFMITEIHEDINNRIVTVQVAIGPFRDIQRQDGTSRKQGSSSRSVMVWEKAEYDTIRDTWTNADLVAAVTAKLAV